MRRLKRLFSSTARSKSSPGLDSPDRGVVTLEWLKPPSPREPEGGQADFSEADRRMLQNVSDLALRVASSRSGPDGGGMHSASTHESPKTARSSTAPIPIPTSESSPSHDMLTLVESRSCSSPTESSLRRSQSDTTGSRRSAFGDSFCARRASGFAWTDKMHGYDVSSSSEQRMALDDYRLALRRVTVSAHFERTRVGPDALEI